MFLLYVSNVSLKYRKAFTEQDKNKNYNRKETHSLRLPVGENHQEKQGSLEVQCAIHCAAAAGLRAPHLPFGKSHQFRLQSHF
jgi:hypothetical protein